MIANWPFGLRVSDAILARNLLQEIPAEAVSLVSSEMRALISLAGFVTPAVACWMYVRAVAEGMRKISYAGYRFPPEAIHQAIWLYLRFTLSFRDVEDLLAERGIAVSYETVRRWGNHFGPMIAAHLRKRRPKPHATWHLDEVYLNIDGRMVYLWRAADAEGEVLDVLVQSEHVVVAQTIKYCRAPDGVRIAYAISGSGPFLVKSGNWMNHLEYDWESPIWRHFFRGLSRGHTLIRYDARGHGMSDWDVDELSLDAWVTDLETVVDTVGVDRFPLLGISQGGAVAVAYAAQHPERVSHLILYGAFALGGQKRAPAEKEMREAMK